MKYKIKTILLTIIIMSFLITPSYKKETIKISAKEKMTENIYEIDPYDYYSTYEDETDYYNQSAIEIEVNSYKVILEDDASLLNPDEEERLLERMKKIAEYGNVIFKTINKNEYGTAEYFAENYFHTRLDVGVSGTMFLIDMDTRMIYIFSDGEIYKTITNTKAEIITDNTYRYATNQKYFDCADETFYEIYTLLNGGKISQPMKYISNAILSLVISVLIGFLIAIKGSKIKNASTKDNIKSLNKSFEVSGEITAKKTGQKKVYNPPSDSGGGGSSGGGGGGGGGSSGGGGGHSF